MAKSISSFLIVSEARRLCDSLRVLLKSCYPDLPIDEARTGAAALRRVAEDPHTLVLLDADLSGGQVWQVLGDMGGNCLVLAHSLEQQKRAGETGAKAILLDGFTAEGLYSAVKSGVEG